MNIDVKIVKLYAARSPASRPCPRCRYAKQIN